MRIPRIYFNGNLHEGLLLTLPPETSHYIIHVLRLKKGSLLILFNGLDGEFNTEIIDIHKKQAAINVKSFIARNVESPLKIHLAQGISRQDKMDLVIQKAVELGVSTITPLITEFCGVKLDKERLEKRLDHWRKVIISACEQSGRNIVPTLFGVTTFANWLLNGIYADSKLICHPNSSQTIATISKPTDVILLIGPEGGLSDNELMKAKENNYTQISLGPRVLRTETATLAAITLLQGYWGDI